MYTKIQAVSQSTHEITSNLGAKTEVLGDKLRVEFQIEVWKGAESDQGRKVAISYSADKCVYKDGLFYWSLEDNNVDVPPSSKWSRGFTIDEIFQPMRYVDVNKLEVESGDQIVTVDSLDLDIFKIVNGKLTVDMGDK